MIRSKVRSVVMTVIVEGVKGTGVVGVSRASQRCCTVSNFPVSSGWLRVEESRRRASVVVRTCKAFAETENVKLELLMRRQNRQDTRHVNQLSVESSDTETGSC